MTTTESDWESLTADDLANLFRPGTDTDVGNANRFIYLHGDDVRYVQESDRSHYWVYWAGTHWNQETNAEVKRMARHLIDFITWFVQKRLAPDDGNRVKWLRLASAIQNGRRLASALDHASYDERINVSPDVFDLNPLLLNCQNGTLDLQGLVPVLRPHRREDLLRQIVPVPYDAEARSERWESALKFWLPDLAVQQFLQRYLGSALTGRVIDDYFPVLVGDAGTGKSTFVNGVKAVLGNYARSANASTVMRRREGAPTNDLARLAGARLVVMLETSRGKAFDAEMLKRIASGDDEVARFLYREFREFRWTAKWLLGTNEAPEVTADDEGVWRRLVYIDFDEKVPAAIKDKELRDDLRGKDPALMTVVLTWLVEGWQAWRAHGLDLPPSLVKSTSSYRATNKSLLDQWLEDVAVFDEQTFAANADIHRSLKAYGLAQGADEKDIPSMDSVGRRLAKLKARGLRREKSGNNTRGWKGLRVPTAVEAQTLKISDAHDGRSDA